MAISINAGLGEVRIVIPDGNLKLQFIMDELKEFIEQFGVDELYKILKQKKFQSPQILK